MPRFYTNHPLALDDNHALPESVLRHIQVLRLRVGDTLTLFNGQGGEWHATLTHLDKRSGSIRIHHHDPIERESPLRVELVQAVSHGDRMDYTLQKAVELGVMRIQPLITQRVGVRLSEDRWAKKQAHWQGVVIAACEQCGRNTIPEVLPVLDWTAWQKQNHHDSLTHDDECTTLHRWILSPVGTVCLTALRTPNTGECVQLLAGAEGGLTPDEESSLLAQGWLAWRLGSRILRTETAALAALAILQAHWGDLG